ncbi:hypothetical protein [Thermospira aquatica]|uniref:Transposase n=1 Tax=Thermospira aquatica TaxID=2828656 RepID=A0AAX3BBP1_9SPIR|nr:hypothetical protein [Thermospira aquatica]URA09670.1 hypothetical protein KDW03_09295 [Thermospira aquatica]
MKALIHLSFRALGCKLGYVSEAQKERLTRLYKALDLFHLRQKITACQRKLFSLQKKKNVKNKNLEETVWNF